MSSNQYDTIRNLRRDQGAPKASTAYSSSYSSGGGETFSTQPTEPVKPRAQASGPTGMERLSGMFGGNGPRRNFNMDALFKMDDMTPSVQKHLTKVYSSLAATLLAASVGAYIHMSVMAIGGMMSSIACMGLMMWLSSESPANEAKRVYIMISFGFFKGASIGPLIQHAMHVDPTIILTAFLGATAIFGCFTAAALVAKRRSYLFLGGTLASVMSFMMVTSLLNMFFRSGGMNTLHLYLGLLSFTGYVLFDTQMILEKAHGGDRDYVWHAVELFIDFVQIFYRLVIILMRNNGGQQRRGNGKDEERRRR